MWVVYLIAGVLILVAALAGWRQLDHRADAAAWTQLAKSAKPMHLTYDTAMVDKLPEPARRYFDYTIEPGTPLNIVVEIAMQGEIGLGSKHAPNYRPMRSHQLLAPPFGLVWKLHTGPISGSDGILPQTSWTRFWLFGLIPIVRASGPDHQRSAFGRVVAEAAFWSPASLLPSEHVRWQPLDDNSAQAIVRYGGFEQAVEIHVDGSGAPTRVRIQRWSNVNADREYREQPFGGELSEFRRFAGYRLPTRVEGGNHIGTSDYFPFFRADVMEIRFSSEITQP
jgi:hypothetical protein